MCLEMTILLQQDPQSYLEVLPIVFLSVLAARSLSLISIGTVSIVPMDVPMFASTSRCSSENCCFGLFLMIPSARRRRHSVALIAIQNMENLYSPISTIVV